ncbi:hypothetical protein ONS95_002018 [Cadophora gregata]|uniref:uncharacterized protein n=1 Tax=Cadophora gregata TaxID=51156 RepID=UPI0026DB617E|nr:uncharacterized protein ONS95_002018 [Cadophora gregata]KAK0111673.1 hypothetical protein ONS95_002018 [Cadophora gregata]
MIHLGDVVDSPRQRVRRHGTVEKMLCLSDPESIVEVVCSTPGESRWLDDNHSSVPTCYLVGEQDERVSDVDTDVAFALVDSAISYIYFDTFQKVLDSTSEIMHTHIAILASLGLLGPGLAAPLSANVEISISDDTSSSVPASAIMRNNQNNWEYCLPGRFPPDFPCKEEIGEGWYYSEKSCCRENAESISNLRQPPIVSPSKAKIYHDHKVGDICRLERFPPNFPCDLAFGEGWYYSPERHLCCQKSPEDSAYGSRLSDSPYSAVQAPAPGLETGRTRNSFEYCRNERFPPDFPCSDFFGDGWYYSDKVKMFAAARSLRTDYCLVSASLLTLSIRSLPLGLGVIIPLSIVVTNDSLQVSHAMKLWAKNGTTQMRNMCAAPRSPTRNPFPPSATLLALPSKPQLPGSRMVETAMPSNIVIPKDSLPVSRAVQSSVKDGTTQIGDMLAAARWTSRYPFPLSKILVATRTASKVLAWQKPAIVIVPTSDALKRTSHPVMTARRRWARDGTTRTRTSLAARVATRTSRPRPCPRLSSDKHPFKSRALDLRFTAAIVRGRNVFLASTRRAFPAIYISVKDGPLHAV